MPPKPTKNSSDIKGGSCGTETDDEGRHYNPHDGNWVSDED